VEQVAPLTGVRVSHAPQQMSLEWRGVGQEAGAGAVAGAASRITASGVALSTSARIRRAIAARLELAGRSAAVGIGAALVPRRRRSKELGLERIIQVGTTVLAGIGALVAHKIHA